MKKQTRTTQQLNINNNTNEASKALRKSTTSESKQQPTLLEPEEIDADLQRARREEEQWDQIETEHEKHIIIKALCDLKKKLYAQAARSIAMTPQKAEAIMRRVDADARHIAFTINMTNAKL